MTETDSIPPLWIDKSELVDEIWVPADHSMNSFISSGIPRSKIFKIHESIDISLFRPLKPEEIEKIKYPDGFQSDSFNFLSIFKLETRKNWKSLVLAFFDEFSAYDSVHLFVHTYLFETSSSVNNRGGIPNPHDFTSIQREFYDYLEENSELFHGRNLQLRPLPWNNFHILNEPILEREMPELYGIMNAFVLPSHGEG